MKKYKVNGKIVIADSLREAIVKYRKFNDAFVLKHFSGKYLSENGDFVFNIDNARRFSTENEAKAKANAMSSEDDTFTVVSVKDAQNYSAGQKFRDPKGRIWEVKSVNGDLLTIAVDGKEMSNKLHKEIFAEWAKTWDVADSVKDYDDEYYEIRYEFTFNGVKRTAKVLVKAKAETDAKSKFANDKTKDGTEKIISVKKLSEDEVKKLIGYGVYVIDGVIKNKQDIINAVRNSQMMEEALKYNTKDKLSKSPSFVYHVKNLINKIAFDSEYELTVKEEAEILNEVLYK